MFPSLRRGEALPRFHNLSDDWKFRIQQLQRLYMYEAFTLIDCLVNLSGTAFAALLAASCLELTGGLSEGPRRVMEASHFAFVLNDASQAGSFRTHDDVLEDVFQDKCCMVEALDTHRGKVGSYEGFDHIGSAWGVVDQALHRLFPEWCLFFNQFERDHVRGWLGLTVSDGLSADGCRSGRNESQACQADHELGEHHIRILQRLS